MTEELKAQLLKLIADTNAAIAVARDQCIEGAVNWGDLQCIAAEQVAGVIPTGEEFTAWRVEIEEASPTATRFKVFVSGHLALLGWDHVEVSTDW